MYDTLDTNDGSINFYDANELFFKILILHNAEEIFAAEETKKANIVRNQ